MLADLDLLHCAVSCTADDCQTARARRRRLVQPLPPLAQPRLRRPLSLTERRINHLGPERDASGTWGRAQPVTPGHGLMGGPG